MQNNPHECPAQDERVKGWRSFLKNNLDFVVVGLIFAGFISIAAQRLGTVPVPDIADESFTLQVPYEMLNRGNLALPMYRYLGGNIENVWHSYTPLYFVILSSFLKVFGWGIIQGRAFNLMTGALLLLITYVTARRHIDWRAGLIAVLMLTSDTLFFERIRMLRNDCAAASVAMLAFNLYVIAERKQRSSGYVWCGLAAGAAVMCHTNTLYMLGAICLLMLIKQGKRLFLSKNFYLFLTSAFAAMAYEIIYDIIDRKNFALQNYKDRIHFNLFQSWGWWMNLLNEPKRYEIWYSGGTVFPDLPHKLLHDFQLLTVASIIYLAYICCKRFRSRSVATDAPARIFLVTIVSVLFHAVITSHKNIYYMAHLTPWFALCVGILLTDLFKSISLLVNRHMPKASFVHSCAMITVAAAALAYSYNYVNLGKAYLTQVNRSEHASFDEFRGVLRSLVAPGLCPVSVKRPVTWLVFPEASNCYATIEPRMARNVDVDGKDCALIISHGQTPYWRDSLDGYTLLGEMKRTPYGDIDVFYTGVNPAYKSIASRRFFFFGMECGYCSEEQIASAPEVWSMESDELMRTTTASDVNPDGEGLCVLPPSGGAKNKMVPLVTAHLGENAIYRIKLEISKASSNWHLVIINPCSGKWTEQVPIPEGSGSQNVYGLFKTVGTNSMEFALLPDKKESAGPVYVRRVAIEQIAPH